MRVSRPQVMLECLAAQILGLQVIITSLVALYGQSVGPMLSSRQEYLNNYSMYC